MLAGGDSFGTGTAPVDVDAEPYLAELDSDGPDGTLVVRGAVDAAAASALSEQLSAATHSGTQCRAVDLSAVTLLCSAGVRALYEARDRCAANGERLWLVAPPGTTAHHVLGIVGLVTAPGPETVP